MSSRTPLITSRIAARSSSTRSSPCRVHRWHALRSHPPRCRVTYPLPLGSWLTV